VTRWTSSAQRTRKRADEPSVGPDAGDQRTCAGRARLNRRQPVRPAAPARASARWTSAGRWPRALEYERDECERQRDERVGGQPPATAHAPAARGPSFSASSSSARDLAPRAAAHEAVDQRGGRVPFDHPLWVLYSSGTTGLPKAIVQGHGGILLEQTVEQRLHRRVGPRDAGPLQTLAQAARTGRAAAPELAQDDQLGVAGVGQRGIGVGARCRGTTPGDHRPGGAATTRCSLLIPYRSHREPE
jgi:acyl-CoA synthetase (AMP-forming)/AMP-acid ligase II